MFIAKYDSSGNNIWARRAGCGMRDAPYILREVWNMMPGPANGIIICGAVNDSVYFGSQTLYGTGPFIASYDAGGSLEWAKLSTYGSGSTKGLADADGICADGSGNIYIAGGITRTMHFDTVSLSSTLNANNMYIAKIGPGTTNTANRSVNNKPISTWPNPAQHELNVQMPGTQYRQLYLYDQLGQMVYSAPIEKGQSFKSINIRKLASGIYYLRLLGDEGSETKKVMIAQ